MKPRIFLRKGIWYCVSGAWGCAWGCAWTPHGAWDAWDADREAGAPISLEGTA